MKKMFRKHMILVHPPLFFGLIAAVLMIETIQTPAKETENKTFEALQQRLISDGFDRNVIAELYDMPRVYFDADGVSLFLMHRESTLNYDQFTSSKYIRKAKNYMKTHEKELSSAHQTYGVDKHVITAIILVETKLGTYLGRRSVFNTLSSMASITDPVLLEGIWEKIPTGKRLPRGKFEKRAKAKAKWAYRELKALLSYAQREQIDPTQLKGSYAGAMGIAQFMPTSVLSYAKDGNNDGRVDLFTHADSIVSVASYLKSFGWNDGIDEKKASKVVYHYNRSSYYVSTVLKVANLLKDE
jgi:membrane-bound lytic murein transglycosylase B